MVEKEPKIPRGWERIRTGNVTYGDRLWNWSDGWWYDTTLPIAEIRNYSGTGVISETQFVIRKKVAEVKKLGKKPDKKPVVKKYLLLEKQTSGVAVGERLEDMTTHGPFVSKAMAVSYLKADAEEHFVPGDGRGDAGEEEWGSDWLLCEVVAVLRPVPRTKVTVTVKETEV